MYLKNLTVLGFKSFADKTALNFQPGVTAIVGPNGCGKSNVSDAIRWVLGEQSAKALRGGEMADVIFNGTDGRKPLGMAEVSLTIGGVDEDHLTAAGVEMAYNEVTVTRRVFRDGGSEYFINKTPCRLKDIQQLFMGTGVGRTSYSIMAQGNITQILSSKPEDRRMIFEEAAGITKYKAQKKEALRKLEYTEQNLLRVADLVREVKRQIGSLQRQAGKARRYKQLSAELQHLDTQLARHQFDQLQAEIARTANRGREPAQRNRDPAPPACCACEDEITQLRAAAVGTGTPDRRDAAARAGAEGRDGPAREPHSFQRGAAARIRGAEHQGHGRPRRRPRNGAGPPSRKSPRSPSDLAASEAALEQHRQTLAAKQDALRKVEEELRQQQEALRQAQADAFAAAQDLTRVRNEITALDLQKQGNVVRLEKLSAEKIQLEEERTRLESRLAGVRGQCRGGEAQCADPARHGGRTAGAPARAPGGIEPRRAGAGPGPAAAGRKALAAQRAGTIAGRPRGFQRRPAGRAQAVASMCSARWRTRFACRTNTSTAIETALGHHLQLVLTEQPESARQILADLNTNKKGRASIAPLAFIGERPRRGGFRPTSDAADACITPALAPSNSTACRWPRWRSSRARLPSARCWSACWARRGSCGT